MTKKNIVKAIKSSEFKNEVSKYIQFAANIKLEKFISYSLSKSLIKQGFHSVLERNSVDITVNDIKIELKFHFDFDIVDRLSKEMDKNPNLVRDYEKNEAEKKSKSWRVGHMVAKDIIDEKKRCDFFVWIISDRDYESYKKVLALDDICYGKKLKEYANKKDDAKFETTIIKFSKLIKKRRTHYLEHEVVPFNGPLKTMLHFYIFEFSSK